MDILNFKKENFDELLFNNFQKFVILKTIDQESAVLEKILVTHAHLDHIGAVAELASKLSIPIEGTQEDRFDSPTN